MECSRNPTISGTLELKPLKNFIAQMKVSTGCEEKSKVVHGGIQSVLDGFYRWDDENFEMITSSSSCRRLVPFVVSNCCD